MSKKDNLMKGFNNLIQSTENKVDEPPKEVTTEDMQAPGISNTQTSKSLDSQKYKLRKNAKYKELRKCTLYLPPEIMDSLAVMKIKTKKDLSVLTAEALTEYLTINKFLNV